MSDRSPGGEGFSCLGCGGCLTVFVIVASLAFFAIAGADWLPEAVATAIIVAFLIGIIALERDRIRSPKLSACNGRLAPTTVVRPWETSSASRRTS